MINMPNSKNPPTSNRREDLRRQQAEAAKRGGRVTKIVWAGGLAIVAALIGVIIFALVQSGGTSQTASGTAGPIVIGNANAKATVSIYTDFMCPYCGDFERANRDDLQAAIDAGTAKLEIHPLSFLDQASAGSKYSTRAANAFVTIAEESPEAAWKFNGLLFENQPEEGSTGLSDEELKALALEAGASQQVADSLSSLSNTAWVEKVTADAFSSGVEGTPTVKINGTLFSGDLYTAGPLAAAINEAAGA